MRPWSWTIAALAMLTGCPTATLPDDDDVVPVEPSPPGPMEISLAPAEPTSSDDLVVQTVVESTDPDGDLAEVRYAWEVDGEPRPDLDGQASVGAGLTTRGELWAVVATPVAAGGLTGPSAAAAARLGHSPPGAPIVAIEPPTPVVFEHTLWCVVNTEAPDADGDAVEYSITWEVDGQPYPREGDAGPLTSLLPDDTVPVGDPGPGEDWTCRVTPADADAPGEPGIAVVTIEAGPPQPDFSLVDVNETSATFGTPISPRDHLKQVSGWYFGHAT